MEKKNYFQINSIVKAFALIDALTPRREFELAELCKTLAFPKPTVHRILLTLQSIGYVAQNPENGRYFATVKFFELGSRVMQNMNLRDIAHPLMIELSKKTGETVNLGILDGIDVVCIDKVETQHFLRTDQPIGSRLKSYQTGFGKAILAFLKEENRSSLFLKYNVFVSTKKSMRNLEEIEKDLKSTMRRGYSIDNEESLEGVTCVGAPVVDHSGKVLAGISVAAPTLRMRPRRIPRVAALVKVTAASISRLLGGTLNTL
jgi:IclR family KDG regulon transcriptional repressor